LAKLVAKVRFFRQSRKTSFSYPIISDEKDVKIPKYGDSTVSGMVVTLQQIFVIQFG
jgi:hypothetical protein